MAYIAVSASKVIVRRYICNSYFCAVCE